MVDQIYLILKFKKEFNTIKRDDRFDTEFHFTGAFRGHLIDKIFVQGRLKGLKHDEDYLILAAVIGIEKTALILDSIRLRKLV